MEIFLCQLKYTCIAFFVSYIFALYNHLHPFNFLPTEKITWFTLLCSKQPNHPHSQRSTHTFRMPVLPPPSGYTQVSVFLNYSRPLPQRLLEGTAPAACLKDSSIVLTPFPGQGQCVIIVVVSEEC